MTSKTEDVGRGIQDTDEGIRHPFSLETGRKETIDSSGFVGSAARARVNSYLWL